MSARTGRRGVRIGAGLAALAGLAAIVGLIAYQGFAEVGGVMMAAGWGIALVTAFHLLPMAASALAWRAAAAAIGPARVWLFLWGRLLREAINGLLPVAQVGGDIVGARILTFHGWRAPAAGASVLADLTLELLTQILFTAAGLILLFADGGHGLAEWGAAGLAVAAGAVGGFLLAQRWGIFLLLERLLERMARHLNWPALGSLANLHDTVMAIYRRPAAMIGGTLWHLASWLLGAVEVWLALRILGADIGFAEALIIESLGQALRTAAFLVPGAFGVQESGYMLLGMQFGLAPEVALSVSLIKRVRELVLGVPAMLVWQFVEGRRLVAVADPGTERAA
jgi:putative membrane protein